MRSKVNQKPYNKITAQFINNTEITNILLRLKATQPALINSELQIVNCSFLIYKKTLLPLQLYCFTWMNNLNHSHVNITVNKKGKQRYLFPFL